MSNPFSLFLSRRKLSFINRLIRFLETASLIQRLEMDSPNRAGSAGLRLARMTRIDSVYRRDDLKIS